MRVVFVENHDSFSWNVIDTLPVTRAEIAVVRADEALGALEGADVLVIGPGPMDPARAGLVGVVQAAAARRLPTLGVCLGHQAIGLAFGARLVRSTPAHGKTATVRFARNRSFGLEGTVEVMRYHSLSLEDVRAPLDVVARLDDGTVMAIEHRELPMAGVQFHPDSHGTPRGRALIEAFFRDVKAPPAPHRGEARTASARTTSPSQTLALSTLEERDDFVLLGPGFGGGSAWSLLTRSPGGARATAWFAPYEAKEPVRFDGALTEVELELDVEPAALTPRLDDAGFLEGVETIREAIAAGDVYQVNLTARAHLEPVGGAALLAALCRREVPRFAAWLKVRGVGELVSASPELLFERRGTRVHVEPMKGTAPAGARAWLEASEKDRAELAMITDLLRDDLHRLCEPRSVVVENPRRFIELPYVVQAVSDVAGVLPEGTPIPMLLSKLHPGGSVTGAPREAACRLISALEQTPRGAYCGTLGLERGDEARFALLIRTAQRTEAGWTYGVGSGITWDSDARAELEEVRLKLGALGEQHLRARDDTGRSELPLSPEWSRGATDTGPSEQQIGPERSLGATDTGRSEQPLSPERSRGATDTGRSELPLSPERSLGATDTRGSEQLSPERSRGATGRNELPLSPERSLGATDTGRSEHPLSPERSRGATDTGRSEHPLSRGATDTGGSEHPLSPERSRGATDTGGNEHPLSPERSRRASAHRDDAAQDASRATTQSTATRYTTLRVTQDGVVLFEAHRERLGFAPQFDEFARAAAPGIYSLRLEAGALEVTRREGSRLVDGLPVRFMVSPVHDLRGPQRKRPSPSPWDAVRAPGVATLLTSADGSEIYESCVAAVLAWDGETLVAVPDDRPRVASITERVLLAHHPHRRAPVLRASGWALMLVNAVAGVCVPEQELRPPAELVRALGEIIRASARRTM